MINGEDIYKLMQNYADETIHIYRFSLNEPTKLMRYKFIDPISAINVCLLFKYYDLAFPFDVIPNFEKINSEFIELIKDIHYDFLKHVEFIFDVGEVEGIKGPYISLSKINVRQIKLQQERVYDKAFNKFIKGDFIKTDRKIFVDKSTKTKTTKEYYLSYSIEGGKDN